MIVNLNDHPVVIRLVPLLSKDDRGPILGLYEEVYPQNLPSGYVQPGRKLRIDILEGPLFDHGCYVIVFRKAVAEEDLDHPTARGIMESGRLPFRQECVYFIDSDQLTDNTKLLTLEIPEGSINTSNMADYFSSAGTQGQPESAD